MSLLDGRAARLGNMFTNPDFVSSATSLDMKDHTVAQTQQYVLGAALRPMRSGLTEYPNRG